MVANPDKPKHLYDSPCAPWLVCIVCRTCEHTSGISPRVLADHINWATPVKDVAKHLRCSRCRSKNVKAYAYVFPDEPWCCLTGRPAPEEDT